jgi:endonuclease YncB( thermonuclease family)
LVIGKLTIPVMVSAAFLAAGGAAADELRARILGTARVVDGDTLDLGVVRIRLNGIDAPEAGQRCSRAGGGTWACGEAAIAELVELAEGKSLECVAIERDAYGRIVADCAGPRGDLSEAMMRAGLAWAFVRYSDQYASLEAKERSAGLGVWQAPTQPPWDYRADKWNRAAAASPRPGCPIKGNISGDEKIYHTPWSPAYERTKIDESRGERWFCDEAEAVAAGWRAPYWR